MNFLTPEALAFAATLPVVVVFYLLTRRRVARLVSSTVLWQRFLNETQASSPFQKLRHNWLLVIQLILLALAVFALTRPYFAGKLESGRFIVAILDVSASMQSTDVSPSRLGQAKADLAKLIDSMYDNDRVVLLLAGAVTEVRQSPTSAKSALRSALGQVRATDSPTRLLDAIKLAQNLTRNRAKTEVHLFSDGASPDLDEFELQDLSLAYHRVGGSGDNLGIVSLEVRPHPEQAGQQAIFATIANAFTNPLTNSYKRLVPGFEAPVLLAYSARNRSASCRIPFGSSPKAKRVEVRFPDPGANPYLGFAAMLMAGLDGIKNKIHPGQPMDKDLYDLPPKELKKIPTVCGSLREALMSLDKDRGFLKAGGVFDDDQIDAYIELKMHEVMRFEMTPHPVEFDMYYSC